ncbi:predicted protein [Streptomyces viridosporus ATCC 14672]|uniref:Predicted protein n=1 Tax=Streptomyces viridosporus (strain ATCC 14672 / DSM 40746 / JCM 4963 / KCTC 9882 / NRRL B-12104 / FH 1290) TaxID=566461 RepID=D5ZWZ4_STRV1|nr:predicted protein [Streptomyces viridosporus ATCC 14672]
MCRNTAFLDGALVVFGGEALSVGPVAVRVRGASGKGGAAAPAPAPREGVETRRIVLLW